MLRGDPLGLRGGAHHIDRRGDDLIDVDEFDVQPQLAGDDAADLEEVVDGSGSAPPRCAQRSRIGSRAQAAFSGPSEPLAWSNRPHPRIAFNGVRSSWLTVARKSSLSRVASLASSRAATQVLGDGTTAPAPDLNSAMRRPLLRRAREGTRSSSRRLRSERSRVTLAESDERAFVATSRIGVIITLAQKREPSFRRRQLLSSSKRPQTARSAASSSSYSRHLPRADVLFWGRSARNAAR